ncbi:MAG: DUF6427 family protein [Bacteroidales bacterium]|nr:DUF6427 family protein [Bacteroidales bacterium]MCF8391487.1 DUF6427 family protein [Bacteroidales bacterium]
MLLRLFSGSKASTVFSIFLLSVILWLPSLISSKSVHFSQSESMILYAFIEGFLTKNVLLSKILAFIFLLFQAYLLVLISGKYILLQGRSYLPALFFLLIVSFYSGLQQFSAGLIGSFFVIISINFLFEAYDKESISYRFFDAGLILGLGSLFYAKLILFFPVLWISAIILRKGNWREFVMPVFGVILPMFVVAAIGFLREGKPWELFQTMNGILLRAEIPMEIDFGFLLIIGILFLAVLISSVYMLNIFQFKKIFIRNYYLLLFWIFVTGLVVFILFSSFDMGIAYIIAIPTSFILSNYYFNAISTLGNRILFGMILLVFVFNGVNQIFGWI